MGSKTRGAQTSAGIQMARANWFRGGLAAMAMGVLGGCGPEPLPGYLWRVKVVGAEDTCNDPPVDYTDEQTFDYRLEYSGSDVSIAIGEDAFASGTIAGCEIGYHSVVWPAKKDGMDLKWQLTGDATFRNGGTTCNLDVGIDWSGTETFEVVDSDHPNIEEGCTYTLRLEGAYIGPADGSAE